MVYPSGYYVYLYKRSENSSNGAAGSPYYIGKGKGRRAWKKCKRLNEINIPSNKENISILSENLSEPDAHQLEMLLIFLYGRIDLGTGILRNRTDGGEGTSGRILSVASRMLLSEIMKKEWKTPKRIEIGRRSIAAAAVTNRERKKSAQEIENLRNRMKGRVITPMTDTIRAKISESKKGSAAWNKGMKSVVHGKVYTYATGCRCDLCRIARSEYKKNYYNRKKVLDNVLKYGYLRN